MKRDTGTTHLSPWSLWTETAAWFKLYPFTSVHAAYSDSCRLMEQVSVADKHLVFLIKNVSAAKDRIGCLV